MTPPCHTFPASQLPLEIQINLDGKKRKTEKGKDIDLRACELLSLLQYSCQVDHPNQRDSRVRCYPVERWFRRCNDKKGTFMVETTAWESQETPTATPTDAQAKHRTTTHWHDGNKTDYFPSD
ncbi:hypothetical protein M406DRAFT_268105 [Cryphonectria parasitica EP155]|uniref:Uncharacterized protein n=1 Tax=Cryphonectria parasitica (strain ATCC 38755 / EP155) TaxID=660469 RepID=A0A9P5CKA8_CRYP1|nr:uncharacterized protein M406DRAFT_268105 [Cryphonectria parasitica EP155]KAF3760997.1 hypothetical protein M406DRAFT_268105 [Cryphonectria parasitica EP155]